MNNLLKQLDNVDSPRVIFFVLTTILLILLFSSTWWQGNEENYFQLAFRRVAPNEFSPFHAVFDQSRGRILAESLLGWLIQFVGYESAHLFTRIIVPIFYALGLTVFFRALNLSALMAAGIITVFYLSGQQFFGGEWLFHGVEAKVFAYAAVIASLGYGLNKRWITATILMVIAAYLHFLVGGFWCLALAVLALLSSEKKSTAIRIILFFSLMISPLVIAIAIDQFSGPPIISTLSPGEIYANRSAHHIAPFLSVSTFKNWYVGVLVAGLFMSFFLFVRHFAKEKRLINLSLILLMYLFLALVISFIDRNTHFIGKLYLFRPSSLTLLLSICSIFLLFHENITDRFRPVFRIGIATIVLFLVINQSLIIGYHLFSKDEPVIPASLISIIEKNSEQNDIVLVDPAIESMNIFVERHVPRPTLVSWKFVPTNPHDLIYWNDLIQYRKNIFNKGCVSGFKYPVKLLLVLNSTANSSVKNCGDIIWRSKDMSLINISSQWRYKRAIAQ